MLSNWNKNECKVLASRPQPLCSSRPATMSPRHSHGPPFSCGHREQCQQSPEHVVIVKVVLLPLSWLSFHFLLLIIQVLAPGMRTQKRLEVKDKGSEIPVLRTVVFEGLCVRWRKESLSNKRPRGSCVSMCKRTQVDPTSLHIQTLTENG